MMPQPRQGTTVKGKIHKYDAEGITVYFEPKRCIHALDCIRGLPEVFSMHRRRWVDATKAAPSEIAATVESCPTGALQYRRKDGGSAEQIPERNEVRASAEGPLYLLGNLEIHTSAGVIRETRVALCRCGASRNKPFCDNSHEMTGFYDSDSAGVCPLDSQSGSGVLRVLVETDGPYVIAGTLPVDGNESTASGSCPSPLSLCRCGKTQRKPFCDGSHQRAGFKAA